MSEQPQSPIKSSHESESGEGSTSPVAPAAPSGIAPAPAEELIDIDYFAKVKLRVARIESAEPVPKSSKLLKLQVDLGTEGKRQILAGIGKQFAPENLIGKQIVIVANLKPAKLMGLESQGMLLAAGDDVPLALLHPGSEVALGSRVR